MTFHAKLTIALASFGLLACVGCGGSKVLLGDPLVSAVKDGTIQQFPNVPIGKAFAATFDDPKWTSGESAKGVTFVDFNGHLKLEKHKHAFDKVLAVYQKCAAVVDEVRRMPNYSFVEHGIGNNFLWRSSYRGRDVIEMAEKNKGNEERIAELFNSNPDHVLIEQFGKIGTGSPAINNFVKEAGDITICGPDSIEKLASVQFQFQFTPNGKSFSLTYVDIAPWTRIGVSSQSNVLKYVFK